MASSGKSGIATLLGFRGESPNSLKVPPAPYVDTTDAQKDAVLGNLANFPDIAKLGSETNEEMAKQYLALLQMLGLKGLYDQNTSNLESMSRGELPKDVEDYLARKAAEEGVVAGTSGSGGEKSEFDKYRKLRHLGLESLALTQRALGSSAQWLAQAGNRQFNFTSMFQTPAMRIATEQWNEVNRFNAQFMRNQIKMLPSNEDMFYAQVLDYVADWATIMSGYGTATMMGGAAGGGGGGGGATVPQYSAYGQNALVDSTSFGGGYSAPSTPAYTPPPQNYYSPGSGTGTLQPGGIGAP